MLNIIFIRHLKTKGNKEKRYIGTTDESLLKEEIEKVNINNYPKKIQKVYSSPLKRCIETSKCIYKNFQPVIYENLKECDFGDFENKNYKELSNNIYYQKWIDSNGKLPFPNGESHEKFKKRCIEAFEEIIKEAINLKEKNIALVVHGGTIMAILEKFEVSRKSFYDYQVKNGCGFIGEIDEEKWNLEKEIKIVKEIKIPDA